MATQVSVIPGEVIMRMNADAARQLAFLLAQVPTEEMLSRQLELAADLAVLTMPAVKPVVDGYKSMMALVEGQGSKVEGQMSVGGGV